MTPLARSRLRRTLAWGAAAVVLALVFASYMNPRLMVALVTQAWNCF